jgi:hypothetical protein
MGAICALHTLHLCIKTWDCLYHTSNNSSITLCIDKITNEISPRHKLPFSFVARNWTSPLAITKELKHPMLKKSKQSEIWHNPNVNIYLCKWTLDIIACLSWLVNAKANASISLLVLITSLDVIIIQLTNVSKFAIHHKDPIVNQSTIANQFW